jgi:hypothetical protein
MLTPLTGLLATLAGFTIYYLASWWRGVTLAQATPGAPPEARAGGFPTPAQLGLGFVTNFFDTLGIGSFAPTTAAFKFFKMVPDRLIPGTLNVGHTLGAITQTFIYTLVIEVEVMTLVLMIGLRWRARGSARGSWPGGRSARSRSAWAVRCSSRRRSSPGGTWAAAAPRPGRSPSAA